MKKERSYLANETLRLKLIITILILAVILAIGSPLWTWPLAVRIVLAIITGALFSLSINHVNKLNGIADGSLKLVERSTALTELTQKTLDDLLSMTNRPVNPERLKGFYLSIVDIYIHFIDESLIHGYYQNLKDLPIPSKITLETAQANGSTGSVSISGSIGKLIDGSGQLTADHSIAEKETIEKTYPEANIEKKVIAWQSSMIHLDKIGLGYEYSLWQLNVLGEGDNSIHEKNEGIPDTTKEIVRLMGVNGFILINGNFALSESNQNNYYELTLDHPLNCLDETVNISFKVRLPKSEIPKHISDNSYLDKKNINVIVAGYVNLDQYDGTLTESQSFINVNPIVVYSTPTSFSDNKLLAKLIEKYSLRNEYLKDQKKVLEVQGEILETQVEVEEYKEKKIASLKKELESLKRELEVKGIQLESVEKDWKIEVARNQE